MRLEYYTFDEFEKVYESFGIIDADFEACREASNYFHADIEMRENYTFTELRYIEEVRNYDSMFNLGIFIMRDALLFVEMKDYKGIPRTNFEKLKAEYGDGKCSMEDIVAICFEMTVADDFRAMEIAYQMLNEIEERILKGNVDSNFDTELHEIKKYLFNVKAYYDQLVVFIRTLTDNYNEILDESRMLRLTNIGQKVSNYKEEVRNLIDQVGQLQSTYNSHVDTSMNNTMKILTIITTIFMPLTLIAGWYGMNFVNMPELVWDHGYLYVILLSLVMVGGIVVVGKKKKWF